MEVHQSHQAVACRKRYAVELWKPQRLLLSFGKCKEKVLEVNPYKRESMTTQVGVMLFSSKALYADWVSYQAYYSEEGKAHYMGNYLTEVRSPQRKLVPGKVGLDKCEQTSLWGITTGSCNG